MSFCHPVRLFIFGNLFFGYFTRVFPCSPIVQNHIHLVSEMGIIFEINNYFQYKRVNYLAPLCLQYTCFDIELLNNCSRRTNKITTYISNFSKSRASNLRFLEFLFFMLNKDVVEPLLSYPDWTLFSVFRRHTHARFSMGDIVFYIPD